MAAVWLFFSSAVSPTPVHEPHVPVDGVVRAVAGRFAAKDENLPLPLHGREGDGGEGPGHPPLGRDGDGRTDRASPTRSKPTGM